MLKAELVDMEKADLSSAEEEVLILEDVSNDALFEGGVGGLEETTLDVDSEDTAGGMVSDLSKDGRGSTGLEMVCVDGGDESSNFLGSNEDSDLSC